MTTESESHHSVDFDEAFVRHRPLLLMLARMLHVGLNKQYRNQIDPSDVVQDALLDGLKCRDQFRGNSDEQLVAWLRQILRHRFVDAFRKLKVPPDQVLQFEQTSIRIESWQVGEQTSPSENAVKHEQLCRLAEALGRLEEPQQEAVRLRHLSGWSLRQIGDHMGRSEPAIAGLIHRGLKRLRNLMREIGDSYVRK